MKLSLTGYHEFSPFCVVQKSTLPLRVYKIIRKLAEIAAKT